VVAFKSIIAYRTGLAVSATVSQDEAERSLREVAPLRRRAKACRDWLLRLCLATASDLAKPFQIHSGLGDSDLRLSEANPLLLEELLRTPEASAAKILIMVAYPWHEELAYMVTTKPNVWADLSMFNLYAPMTYADRLLRTLDMAPATKVLLGSDGYSEPEVFWFGAMILRDAWQTTRHALASAGARPAWLKDVEQMIFAENARSFYGLSTGR
jgi:predicted TIM-barrel fold metal-dependent hydrolase